MLIQLGRKQGRKKGKKEGKKKGRRERGEEGRTKGRRLFPLWVLRGPSGARNGSC